MEFVSCSSVILIYLGFECAVKRPSLEPPAVPKVLRRFLNVPQLPLTNLLVTVALESTSTIIELVACHYNNGCESSSEPEILLQRRSNMTLEGGSFTPVEASVESIHRFLLLQNQGRALFEERIRYDLHYI